MEKPTPSQTALDPNTNAKGKRTITITLTMVPDENREMVGLVANVSVKLQQRAAVSSILMVGHDDNTGEAVVKEYAPGANPGQHTLPDEAKTPAQIAEELRASGVHILHRPMVASGGE